MERLIHIEQELRLDEMLFRVCPEAFEEGWKAFIEELNDLAYEIGGTT